MRVSRGEKLFLLGIARFLEWMHSGMGKAEGKERRTDEGSAWRGGSST